MDDCPLSAVGRPIAGHEQFTFATPARQDHSAAIKTTLGRRLYFGHDGTRGRHSVKCKTAKSISELLEFVGEARDQWNIDDHKELWFRGEDAKHNSSTLQPKLYRRL